MIWGSNRHVKNHSMNSILMGGQQLSACFYALDYPISHKSRMLCFILRYFDSLSKSSISQDQSMSSWAFQRKFSSPKRSQLISGCVSSVTPTSVGCSIQDNYYNSLTPLSSTSPRFYYPIRQVFSDPNYSGLDALGASSATFVDFFLMEEQAI